MDEYTYLAQVYDSFMEDVDYPAWCRFITGKLRQYGAGTGLVCELGCGTGNMTELLADAGYDMIGIDSSADMLSVAGQRQLCRAAKRGEASEPEILYLQQDMRSFELYGTVRAVVSVCDCLNYITEEDDLRQVFRLVNNYLDPGGIFLFDMNMPVKYEAIGEDVIAENREDGSFIWENSYDADLHLNEYALTLFLPEQGGIYRKREEIHLQRAWTREETERLLAEAGLKLLETGEAYTGKAASDAAERMYYIARETGKRP